jgi:hypothetical protein
MVESKKTGVPSMSFRTVTIAHSSSHLQNNISASNSNSFAVIKNSEKGGMVTLFG